MLRLGREGAALLAELGAGAAPADLLNAAVLRGLEEKTLFLASRFTEARARLAEQFRLLERCQERFSGAAPLPALDAARLPQWDARLRPALVRAWMRYGEQLNVAGQTVEAVAFLETARKAVGDPSQASTETLRFYAGKLTGVLADLRSFLGYRSEGVALLESLVAQRGLGDASACIAAMNLERMRSRLSGPDAEALERVRQAVAAYRKHTGRDSDPAVDRLLAKMEDDLKTDSATPDRLRKAGDALGESGQEFESFLARRDALDYDRESDALEPEYLRLLLDARRRGRLVSEPALYRSYAGWLGRQQRWTEALTIYGEALRQVRENGWHLHLPPLLLNIMDARLMTGDATGAARVLAEIEGLRRTVPGGLPPERELCLWLARVHFEAWSGHAGEAHRVAAAARTFAASAGLTKWQQSGLDHFSIEDAVKTGEEVRQQHTPVPGPASELQPILVSSESVRGEEAWAWFTLTNPGSAPVTGTLSLHAAAVAAWDEPAARWSVTVTPGAEAADLTQPVRLEAGEQALVMLHCPDTPAGAGTRDMAALRWEGNDRTTPSTAIWTLTEVETSPGMRVVNASLAAWNPFYAVSLYHQFHRDPATPGPAAFRLRAEPACRLDLVDTATGRLIGVDNDGNGILTDPGDYLDPAWDPDGDGIPDAAFRGEVPDWLLEFRVHGVDPAMATEAGTRITVDVRNGAGAWDPAAENTLRVRH